MSRRPRQRSFDLVDLSLEPFAPRVVGGVGRDRLGDLFPGDPQRRLEALGQLLLRRRPVSSPGVFTTTRSSGLSMVSFAALSAAR